MAHPIVLDLETQFTFRQFSNPADLKISVVGVYDYATDTQRVFEEKELSSLFPLLEGASMIIGYNSDSFDLPVLQPYYPGNVAALSSFDLLDDIKVRLGRRISLNDVAAATLGKKKSGHGLQAIEFFKEGRWEELKKYCLDDVMITKELFDFGVEKGEIRYPTPTGSIALSVDWKRKLQRGAKNDVSMTLPF